MRLRYSFAVFLLLLVSGLGWWANFVFIATPVSSHRMRSFFVFSSEEPQRPDLVQGQILKRDLFEFLDRLVTYELYYRSLYGRFTKMVSRVGVSIPQKISKHYEIQVIEATSDRLLIRAFSEADHGVVEQVSINENYEVEANFNLPSPRTEYLRVQAMKQLRQLRSALQWQDLEERGVFKGYFKYEVRKDSENRKVAFAIGLRPPVAGLQLEFGPNQGDDWVYAEDLALIFDNFFDPSIVSAPAQGTQGDVMSSEERERLAQKIFYGEMGRYAKTLSELSKIANFHFDETKNVSEHSSDKKNQETDRQISSQKKPLEVEPIEVPNRSKAAR